ncbi:MFS transporter [Bradyrhizobium pachyrhizi]|uniref:MFS transporter n=1 Tax=Bradyrhizobium pachyrhizi TaxID=280333 RepID=UPI0024B26785|nr:MFS transporter [Bradyrhizobium pachyrhizi]WFU58322.1 MFS transporter [Bradyrhizobium pachyrhizi]
MNPNSGAAFREHGGAESKDQKRKIKKPGLEDVVEEAHCRGISVAHIIDNQGLNSFSLRVIGICFVVVLLEGYDVSVLAFALPSLSKAWSIDNAAALGPVLSASIIGMMIGSALFGQLGDRFGRRKLIIGACSMFALFTGLVLFATSLDQLFVLRLLAGVGLGGAAPNAIALTSEFAPARQRAMLVTVMYSGIGLGGALPGVVSSLFMATYGWHSLFWIGGVLPLIVAVACSIWLPESPAYLVARSRNDEALRTLRMLAHESLRSVSAAQLIGQEAGPAGVSLSQLFRGGLTSSTLLLWTAIIGNFMTYFFLLNWTPALLSTTNLPPVVASLGQTVFQIGGVVGGIVLGRSLDIRGSAVMAFFMLLSIPPTVAIGFADRASAAVLLAAEFAAGFCILGTAYGFAAIAAMIYPTFIRSSGAGWAFGAGRLGAILSTVAAGELAAHGVGLSELFFLAAAPLLVSGIACFALARRQSGSPSLISKPMIGADVPLSTRNPSA